MKKAWADSVVVIDTEKKKLNNPGRKENVRKFEFKHVDILSESKNKLVTTSFKKYIL